jgi:hypothetical protein
VAVPAEPTPDQPASWLPPPPYLNVPPRGPFPGPPVATRPQILPFHELPWEDFERLCLRLLQLSNDIAHVDVLTTASVTRLYGARGQRQAGIDVYSRDPLVLGEAAPRRRYSCLQARRVRRVTKTGLTTAVHDFARGRWAAQSRKFIYATSLPGVATGLSDEVEKQSAYLAKAGIGFELWDAEELSAQLKHLPVLVDDFFGRPWVDLFCPNDARTLLGSRLDGHQITELRGQLRQLYEAVFSVADTGLVALRLRGQRISSIRDRFITPDVLATIQTAVSTGAAGDVEFSDEDTPLGHLYSEASGGYRTARRGDDWRAPRSATRVRRNGLKPDERISADSWLGKQPRQVVVADAGAGKSTLLRFLVLDLLDEEPRWSGMSSRWGDRLPIWLPFHFFTQRVAEGSGGTASLAAAIRAWFEQHDAASIWPLVESALADERLLLVVDGLDEWVNDAAGRYAASAVDTFATTHAAAVVVSTRPYGLSQLALGGGWSYAHIAPLSRAQQRTLSTRYFADAVGGDGDTDSPAVGRSVEDFMREVDDSADLRRVASVPLLLVLLIALRLSSVAALPNRRFEVYDKALQLLIADHPARRRVAAAVVQPRQRVSDHHLRVVLAEAAFRAQTRGDISAIEIPMLRYDVVEALRDRDTLALDVADATAVADQVLDVAEGELGVLTRKGPGALGFLHRMLQDQLAAEHIANRMTNDEQCKVVADHATDARWRDVILGVLWRVSRPHELRQLTAAVRALVSDMPEGLLAREILVEAACGQFGLPGDDARGIVIDAVAVVETHIYAPHRARLLEVILPGLDNPAVADVVEHSLHKWALAVRAPSGYLVWRVAALVPDARTSDTVIKILLRALSNPSGDVAYAAAIAIAARVSRAQAGEPEERNVFREALLSLLQHPVSGQAQAAALVALLLEWPDDRPAAQAVAEARSSADHGVRLVALAHVLGVLRQGLGQADGLEVDDALSPKPITEDERRWLLQRLEHYESGDVHDGLRLAAVSSIARNDEKALDYCITGIDARSGPNLGLLWAVALRAFPNHERFLATLCRHLRTDERPWPMLTIDRSTLHELADAYGPGTENQGVVADAIEDHLQLFDTRHRAMELLALAAVDQGPVMRQILLRDVREDGFPHWASRALVDNFAEDQDAMSELRSLLVGDPQKASTIANAAPVVLGPDTAVTWAVDLLRQLHSADRGRARRDIVVGALLQAWTDSTKTVTADELATSVLPLLPVEPDLMTGDVRYDVATTLHPAAAATELLDQLAGGEDREVASFLRAYIADPERALPFLFEARSLVSALPPSSRLRVCELLRTRGTHQHLTIELTRRWADEIDESNKSAASLAYHSALLAARDRGELEEESWEAARQRLALQAAIYGPDHEARRRAAWVGMCVMKDWSMLDGVVERGCPGSRRT